MKTSTLLLIAGCAIVLMELGRQTQAQTTGTAPQSPLTAIETGLGSVWNTATAWLGSAVGGIGPAVGQPPTSQTTSGPPTSAPSFVGTTGSW